MHIKLYIKSGFELAIVVKILLSHVWANYFERFLLKRLKRKARWR